MIEPNIKNVNFLNELDEIEIPKDKMILVGSATLSLYGVRENKDLDIIVSPNIFNTLVKDERFKEGTSLAGVCMSYKNVDFHDNTFPFKTSVEEELNNALIIDGYYFYSLKRIIEWKQIMIRPKDINDLSLITSKILSIR